MVHFSLPPPWALDIISSFSRYHLDFDVGIKGHMAFVHRVNNEGEGDPFYETVGIITLEDVIEELIQAEIMDETDVYSKCTQRSTKTDVLLIINLFLLWFSADNRSKQRRQQRSYRAQDFTAFAERNENQRIHISPQLTLATFQFLSSSTYNTSGATYKIFAPWNGNRFSHFTIAPIETHYVWMCELLIS